MFPHFSELLSSMETCSPKGAHRAGGSQMCWQESCAVSSNGGGDKSSTGKRADIPQDTSHLLRPTFTNLGDTWELPQEPPVSTATLVPLFLGSHLQEDTLTFIPHFSPEQNGKLSERRKISQVGEAHRSSQNKDTFSDSH